MVETKFGKIVGIDRETYTEYRGIPYAKPPVGKLRWRAPQPMEPWEGVYEATDFRNRCWQAPAMGEPYDKEFYSNPEFFRPMSEDCLYLHIWAPKEAVGKKLPVALWIHGGAFMHGFGSELEFDGKAYCDRGVILVSIEYRCGAFGFLAHPWLTEEDENHISGNYGFLDEIFALRWTYENIEAFGGDPDNITVFGQSAGAMSVQALISSDLTGNQIAKAIMQSGGSYGARISAPVTYEQQAAIGQEFAEFLGAKSLEELRNIPAEVIRDQEYIFLGQKAETLGLFWVPTIDGLALTDTNDRAVETGKIKDIPYMLGTTKADIMVTPEMLEKGEHSPLYDGVVNFSKKLEELGRKPAYTYYFDSRMPGDELGSFHSSELWFMFGTMDRCWRPWEEKDYELSERMLDYWTNFMKTGNPNGENLPEWRPCTEADPYVQVLKEK
jgi:para-nitrobenzyl esterase